MCREIDWAATSLGAPEGWPPSLRLAVRLCLDARVAMSVWAGPESVLIYNDGYPPVLGPSKHPSSLGRPVREVWSEIWDRVRPELKLVLDDAESLYRVDERFVVERDGREEERFFTYSFTPILEEDGTVVGGLKVFTETTDRVLTERDLQRMFDLSHDLLAVAGTDDRYRRVNPAFGRVLGWSREQMLANPGAFFVHPADRERTARELSEWAAGRSSAQFENRYLHADGSYRWLAWTAAPVPEEGLVYVAARDVTGNKRAEQALRESEERFRNLAEAMPQLVWIADDDGAVIYYNSRASHFQGLQRAPSGVWYWQPMVHPEEVAATSEAWDRSVAAKAAYQFEHRLCMVDGSYRWHLSRAHRVVGHDGRARWFGTATDIHEVKLAQERTREADRRKDEYLAMLGHELRNPLAAVRSAAELVRLTANPDPTLRRAADVLERQSSQMSRLIDGLLEVSRIARGKIDLEREVVDLREIVQGVLEDRERSFRGRDIELVPDVPADPVWVDADAVRMAQVVDNLVGNALKFTPPPGRIDVRLWADDGSATLTVRDTGVGIRTDSLDAIFEPFHQEPQDVARGSGGLGVGLALARGLAELHGGSIEARSEGPGRGAEFLVRVPLAVRRPTGRAEPVPRGADARRILIVEDNADAAQMLRRLLELEGHEVSIARHGNEALDRIRDDTPEIVLCDLGLPGMSGHDVCRAVRADATHRDMRLVALTGYGQPDDRRRTLDSGFDEHLVKPVTLAQLRAVLERLKGG